MAAVDVEAPFPLVSLLPKKETQALNFIARNPTFDGRDVKIAIFDSGIDPGAPGLSVTSLGKPKIIHMVDASGAGDVDTSTMVTLKSDDDSIVGLTGRKLKIPTSWPVAVDNQYHVGMRHGYEFYPKNLKSRISNTYLDAKIKKNWNNLQAQTHAKTQQFKDSHQSSKITHKDKDSDAKTTITKNNSEKLDTENNQAKIDILDILDPTSSNGRFSDVGPTYDVICFLSVSQQWHVCVDTSGCGDLSVCQLLSPFSQSQQFGTLTRLDRLNYSVNVHDNGNLVELVSMASPHGTHVASIAAACFPDEPERNGVAPGAQIISICIGDMRLGSMETGTALIRGFSKAVELGADIINMSYGEHSHWTGGRVMDLMQEIVNRFGIIYIVSAGNAGPALSTMGTPPTSSTCTLIGVGAWVSPDMMQAEYSMRERLPATHYTWTSRGPTLDGALGVSICAPGGAITSIPTWCLAQSQLMNGTSMSSPNATGCVALLLSGMKQRQLQYSPFSVKRALENSALKPSTNYDVFAMGAGLVQVEKAFELLSSAAFVKSLERDVRFQVNVTQQNPSGNNCVTSPKNGVYLRQAQHVQSPTVHNITITPKFLDCLHRDPSEKLDFQLSLVLICDAHYVIFPTYLSMSYMSRSFSIRVDPTGLPHGCHYTSIRAYHSTSSSNDRSAQRNHVLFEIPITVIIPISVVDSVNWKIDFPDALLKPDQIQLQRYFINVPHGATSAIFECHNCESSESINAILHTVQLIPGVSHRNHQFHEVFPLANATSTSRCIPVVGMYTIEVVYGKMWSSLGKTQIKASIQFFSLSPSLSSPGSLSLRHSNPITQLDVICSFRSDELAPSAVFKHLATSIKPSESKIQVLSLKRDEIFQEFPTYALNLLYQLQISNNKSTEITVDCPLLSNVMYESEYESQLWMIFDANKRLVAAGDAYPHKHRVDLDKGDYTLRMQIRHYKRAMLEKIEELPVVILSKIGGSSGLSLDIYKSYPDAVRGCAGSSDGGAKSLFKSRPIEPATSRPMYLACLSDKQLKSFNGSIGNHLIGQLTLSKNALRTRREVFPMMYFIDCQSPSSSSGSSNSNSTSKLNCKTPTQPSNSPSKETEGDATKADEKEKEARKNYNEALIDFQLNWLAKVEGGLAKDISDSLDKLIVEDVSKVDTSTQMCPSKSSCFETSIEKAKVDRQVQKLIAQLNSLVSTGTRTKAYSTCEEISRLCDDILEKIKPMELLNQLTAANKLTSATPATNNNESNCVTKELEKKKSIVVDVLTKKGLALCEMIEQISKPGTPATPPVGVNVGESADDLGGEQQSVSDGAPEPVSTAVTAPAIDGHQKRSSLAIELDNLYFELAQWVDMKDSKVAKLVESHAMIRQDYARIVRIIVKQQKDQRLTQEQYTTLISLFRLMGGEWSFLSDHLERSVHVRYPTAYSLF